MYEHVPNPKIENFTRYSSFGIHGIITTSHNGGYAIFTQNASIIKDFNPNSFVLREGAEIHSEGIDILIKELEVLKSTLESIELANKLSK